MRCMICLVWVGIVIYVCQKYTPEEKDSRFFGKLDVKTLTRRGRVLLLVLASSVLFYMCDARRAYC